MTTRFTATYAIHYAGTAAINLFADGVWACGGTATAGSADRGDVYEAAYTLASRVARAKGGLLERFSEAQ